MRDQPLTSELVNAALEAARLEMEQKLAEAGPLAVTTLVDVMQDPEARHGDKISAASKVMDKVYANPKGETEQNRGPVINVVIQKLFAGGERAIPIAVTEQVMDALEAGKPSFEGGFGDE